MISDEDYQHLIVPLIKKDLGEEWENPYLFDLWCDETFGGEIYWRHGEWWLSGYAPAWGVERLKKNLAKID